MRIPILRLIACFLLPMFAFAVGENEYLAAVKPGTDVESCVESIPSSIDGVEIKVLEEDVIRGVDVVYLDFPFSILHEVLTIQCIGGVAVANDEDQIDQLIDFFLES